MIYSLNHNLCLCISERIADNTYLFTKYCCNNNDEENKSNLVFFNRDLRVSYVIENIDYFNVIKTGFENFEYKFVLTFKKDDKKHILASYDFGWDYDKIRKIAEEIEYT